IHDIDLISLYIHMIISRSHKIVFSMLMSVSKNEQFPRLLIWNQTNEISAFCKLSGKNDAGQRFR
ncbi:hypothetical protein RCU65_20945, partial [Escherichia marmotae]|nr:hypothetical protein [Escherichia marmotae]